MLLNSFFSYAFCVSYQNIWLLSPPLTDFCFYAVSLPKKSLSWFYHSYDFFKFISCIMAMCLQQKGTFCVNFNSILILPQLKAQYFLKFLKLAPKIIYLKCLHLLFLIISFLDQKLSFLPFY